MEKNYYQYAYDDIVSNIFETDAPYSVFKKIVDELYKTDDFSEDAIESKLKERGYSVRKIYPVIYGIIW